MQSMKIKDLKPNEDNPRKINLEQKRLLQKSIEKFGDLGGIIFNTKTGKLVGGHQRSSVLDPESKVVITKKYEDPTLVGTTAEGHVVQGGERFSYREVSWDEITEAEAMVAANKHGGEWDHAALELTLGKITDLEVTGFAMDDLKAIDVSFDPETTSVKLEPEEPKKELDFSTQDEIPEVVQNELNVELGDIYQLGEHRLMCGDSTDEETVSKLMNGDKADMVFTDPPYGIAVVSKDGSVGGGTKGKYKEVIGDETIDCAVASFELVQKLGVEQQFFWGANHFASCIPDSSCWVVWDKQGGKSVTFADCELCYTNLKSPVRMFTHIWDGFRRDSEKGEMRVHPTQKPVQLFVDIWDKFKSPNKILDLFLGSGSTLIACEKTNRKCYGMELDPHYCSVIIKRWEQFTGEKAVKI